jgi:sulfide:quinone oxidoreductase
MATTRVLVAGGGVAAIETALALQALAKDEVSVELLSPEPVFWYRPMAVAEPFDVGEVTLFELAELASAAGATYTPGALTGVDVDRKLARISTGGTISYDVLVVACGAFPAAAVPGALTFRGPADTDRMRALLEEIDSGNVSRLAFVVPWGAVWSLPIYELTLLTAAHLKDRGRDDVDLALWTPEDEPLQLFGAAASAAMRDLMTEAGVALHNGSCAAELSDGELRLVPQGSVEIDRAVALPRLQGTRIDGLPQTVDGFIPVDAHCRVRSFDDVFAVGDITSFPVKQGGIATQQADAAAEQIAADAGADVAAQPFRPVLRGLLLTGRRPRYLRNDLTRGVGNGSTASFDPLWWPPSKVVGRYLAPFLAAHAGSEGPPEAPTAYGIGSVEVDVELDPAIAVGVPFALSRDAEERERPTAGEAMRADLVVVAPEDTLGEVAERMRDREIGSVAVAEDGGRLIGILTSHDLVRAFALRVHPSIARVREWMTVYPIVVRRDTPLDEAVTLMHEYDLLQLPVVEGDRPIGMLGLRQATESAEARHRTRLGL